MTGAADRAEPTALFRADAGVHIGSGHVMRCLSLADELVDRGVGVVFATHAPAGLRNRIASSGHEIIDLGELGEAAETHPGEVWADDAQHDDARRVRDLVGLDPDIVVVDHYGLDATWESHFRSDSTRLLVLDDLANRRHDADIVSDQNWYGPHTADRYERLTHPETKLLLGPRYAVLQHAYRRVARSTAPKRWPPRRVVVSFGGTDPSGETEKVVAALDHPQFADLDVDVIIGSRDRTMTDIESLVDQRPRTELQVSVASLAPFLQRADLAIGASGAATWERIAARVPAVVATVSPHQSGVTSALDEHGFSTWIGLTSQTSIETYADVLRDLWTTPPRDVPRLIDGFGAGRLSLALVPPVATDIDLRPATQVDAPACIGLAAERGADEPGLLDGPDAWHRESARLASDLADPSAEIHVVLSGDVPIGCVRAAGHRVDVSLQRCANHETIASAVLDRYATVRRRTSQ